MKCDIVEDGRETESSKNQMKRNQTTTQQAIILKTEVHHALVLTSAFMKNKYWHRKTSNLWIKPRSKILYQDEVTKKLF
jgi:hypothetical protein